MGNGIITYYIQTSSAIVTHPSHHMGSSRIHPIIQYSPTSIPSSGILPHPSHHLGGSSSIHPIVWDHPASIASSGIIRVRPLVWDHLASYPSSRKIQNLSHSLVLATSIPLSGIIQHPSHHFCIHDRSQRLGSSRIHPITWYQHTSSHNMVFYASIPSSRIIPLSYHHLIISTSIPLVELIQNLYYHLGSPPLFLSFRYQPPNKGSLIREGSSQMRPGIIPFELFCQNPDSLIRRFTGSELGQFRWETASIS